jgi:hypothetical protein
LYFKGKDQDSISFNVKPMKTDFKIGLKFSYIKPNTIGKKSGVVKLFTIGPMNLGDPCIEDNSLNRRDCNDGIGSVKGCERIQKPVNHTCNCKEEYNLKPNCKEINFCNALQTVYKDKEVC